MKSRLRKLVVLLLSICFVSLLGSLLISRIEITNELIRDNPNLLSSSNSTSDGGKSPLNLVNPLPLRQQQVQANSRPRNLIFTSSSRSGPFTHQNINPKGFPPPPPPPPKEAPRYTIPTFNISNLVDSDKQRLASSSLSAPTKDFRNLRIAVFPSIRRPNNIEYLSRTLTSWCHSTQAQNTSRWILFIFRLDTLAPINVPETCSGSDVRIVEATVLPPDLEKKIPTPRLRGSSSRMQTDMHNRHMITILRTLRDFSEVEEWQPKSLLFLAEDDFEVCPSGLDRIESNIKLLPQSFSVFYTSAGLNGAIIHTSDISALATYFSGRLRGEILWRLRKDNRPVDHLLYEWSLKETLTASNYLGSRRNYIIEAHPFRHIGFQSAEGHRWKQRADGEPLEWGCGFRMVQPMFFEGIAFNDTACANYTVSPCDHLINRF
eukprot:TRINITY_DN7613_c0_g1::TRINITY_DN7613_c0_g1_i1::g.1948::m.1948 TRINITY_DN7613_c0_g1::TRINITY_DN7613_c0_g1_i1::g.1948  ORF type:complete len:433 (+),score=-5.83 TRINITY_DN7613_c0_g1_i1:194-1492(+)